MRDEHGRFVAGASGNPGGRPRAVQQARDLIEALTPELVMTLMEMVRDDTQPGRTRVAAANSLLDRRYGRPKQEVAWADGLILPLPDDEEPEQAAEPAHAAAPAAGAAPDRDAPAPGPHPVLMSDEPGGPDETDEPAPSPVTVGGPCRLGIDWSRQAQPRRGPEIPLFSGPAVSAPAGGAPSSAPVLRCGPDRQRASAPAPSPAGRARLK